MVSYLTLGSQTERTLARNELERSRTHTLKLDDLESYEKRNYNYIANQLSEEAEYLKQEISVKLQEYKTNLTSKKSLFEENALEIQRKFSKKLDNCKSDLDNLLQKKKLKEEAHLAEKYNKLRDLFEFESENTALKAEILKKENERLQYELALQKKLKINLKSSNQTKELLANNHHEELSRQSIEKNAESKELTFRLSLQKETIKKLHFNIEKLLNDISAKKLESNETIASLKESIQGCETNLFESEETSFKYYKSKQRYSLRSKELSDEILSLKRRFSNINDKNKSLKKTLKRLNRLVCKIPTN